MPTFGTAGSALGQSIQSSEIDNLAVTNAKLGTDLQVGSTVILRWNKNDGVVGTWTAGIANNKNANTNWHNNSAEAIDDYTKFKVWLAKGTYTISTAYSISSLSGILTYKIDESVVGTVDMFGGSGVNTLAEVTGITVSTSGLKTLKFIVESKNGSSSSYLMEMDDFIFITRTA